MNDDDATSTSPPPPTTPTPHLTTFCTSIKTYMISQITLHLERIQSSRYAHEDPAVVHRILGGVVKEMLGEAVRDFPFLNEVDWGVELRKRGDEKRAEEKKVENEAADESDDENETNDSKEEKEDDEVVNEDDVIDSKPSAKTSAAAVKHPANESTATNEPPPEPVKRRRGRPRKNPIITTEAAVQRPERAAKKRSVAAAALASMAAEANEPQPSSNKSSPDSDDDEDYEIGSDSSDSISKPPAKKLKIPTKGIVHNTRPTPNPILRKAAVLARSQQRAALKAQQKALDALKPKRKKGSVPFTTRYQQTLQFKSTYNTCFIPKAYGVNEYRDDYGLGRWAEEMRTEYKMFLEGKFDGRAGRGMGKEEREYKTPPVGWRLEVLEEVGFFEGVEIGEDVGDADASDGNVSGGNDVNVSGTNGDAENNKVNAGANDGNVIGTNAGNANTGNSGTNDGNTRGGASVPAEPTLSTMKIWNYKIQKCREFKTQHGHLNIPNNDPTLGHFSSYMRQLYKQRLESNSKSSTVEQLTKIQREKIAFMDSMEFAFDAKFDVHLKNLQRFKEEHGHTKVPIQYSPDRALGSWAEMIRREHRQTNRGEGSDYLTADRLRKLATVGFTFTVVKQDPWEVTFEKYKVYKLEHGKDPPVAHEELGRWVGKQRNAYRQHREGTLKGYKPEVWEERERQLQEVGFVFLAGKRLSEEGLARLAIGRKITWDERLSAFVAWKEKHGHPYVPTVTDGEDKHLGRWVAAQRMAYKAYLGERKPGKYGKLTAEKALKLANAGFAFDANHIQRTPKDVVVESAVAPVEESYEELEDGYYHEEEVDEEFIGV